MPRYSRIKIKGKMELYHRSIIEKILGKQLSDSCVVHHRDRNRHNNVNSNFIVCEDQLYHALIHKREDAYRATGNPNQRKCELCKQYDLISNMRTRFRYGNHKGVTYKHIKCVSLYNKKYKENKKNG